MPAVFYRSVFMVKNSLYRIDTFLDYYISVCYYARPYAGTGRFFSGKSPVSASRACEGIYSQRQRKSDTDYDAPRGCARIC